MNPALRTFLRKNIFIFTNITILLLSLKSNAQWRETPKPGVIISTRIHGFWEWLPAEYATNPTKTFPLIIYLHGIWEQGDGSLAALPVIISKGIPQKIESGVFPETVFDNSGAPYSYIVLSPQYTDGGVSPEDVDGMVNYAFSHYRIDLHRVYLSGISLGANLCYAYVGNSYYAPKITGIAALAVCSGSTVSEASTIAVNNIAVWGFHCVEDFTCSYTNTVSWINNINLHTPPPSPLAVYTLISPPFNPGFPHDIFWNTYDPNYRPAPPLKNIYEWLIQYAHNVALPVIVKNFDAVLINHEVKINWSTTNEMNSKNFILERASRDLKFSAIAKLQAAVNSTSNKSYNWTDEHPLLDLSYYRLALENTDGSRQYFEIKKILNKNILNKILFIAPNPVSTRLSAFIQLERRQELIIKILDMEGRAVKQFRSNYSEGMQQLNCNMDNLPAGKYFIRIDGSTIHAIEPMIKL